MWKHRLSTLAAACLLLTLGGSPAPARAQGVDGASPEALSSALARARTHDASQAPAILAKQEETCFIQQIACGQTVNSTLATTDCFLDSGFYVDFFEFTGQAGQTITARMSSTAFDTYLSLLDPTPMVVVEDDDGGPGTNSRIVYELDQTSSEWVLAPSSFFTFDTGPYTLSLECSMTCPAGFFTDPQYPDFCFDVTIDPPGGAPIQGNREANCLPDTVCVSGALPGRSELYVRILGPRPNGFLWPTVIRFTPSAVTVVIQQLSTGASQTYMLPAVVGGDLTNLSGVQDRLGFVP
jgi:hypothetical protein